MPEPDSPESESDNGEAPETTTTSGGVVDEVKEELKTSLENENANPQSNSQEATTSTNIIAKSSSTTPRRQQHTVEVIPELACKLRPHQREGVQVSLTLNLSILFCWCLVSCGVLL